MPELPEVETVCRGLRPILVGQTVANVEVRCRDLRVPFTPALQRHWRGQTILGLQRRAKFLVFQTEKIYFLNHLGMTGNWRVLSGEGPLRRHDHVILTLANDRRLVFSDSRRFGFFDEVSLKQWPHHKWLNHLGPEPLEDANFSAEYLHEKAKGRRLPLKSFIMDQKIVVGVGNIYASEALFRAGIKPRRGVQTLRKGEWQRVHRAIQDVLHAAIQAGGTTIRDFRHTAGDRGAFQRELFVYGRADEPCHHCGISIKSKVIGGRSTFWCPQCQN